MEQAILQAKQYLINHFEDEGYGNCNVFVAYNHIDDLYTFVVVGGLIIIDTIIVRDPTQIINRFQPP